MRSHGPSIFILLALLLCQCQPENVSTEPSVDDDQVLGSLDSLEVTILDVVCVYNGFPVVPPVPQYAVVSATLGIRNASQSRIIDTLVFDHGTLYRHAPPGVIFPFTVSAMSWYWNAPPLLPGQTDTVWVMHRFDPQQAPCGDSVSVEFVISDLGGDSTLVRTQTVVFECSY